MMHCTIRAWSRQILEEATSLRGRGHLAATMRRRCDKRRRGNKERLA